MRAPALSVAVCTLDRAGLLAGCLDSIARQQLEGATIEVLVIDNGSTDHTAAVVDAHQEVRRIVEPTRGLSRARNTALREAAAELVAFLDDDARPAPGWAAALVAAGHRFPGSAAFGGPVVLEWTTPRPRWLVPQLERWYSGCDLGNEARVLDDDEHPVGANLAVRRDPAVAAGGFATQLGRIGRSLSSEEEVLLLRRLRAEGWDVAWSPDAEARHLVEAGRMTRRWLLRRSWAQGHSDVVAARLEGRTLVTKPWRAAAGAVARGWPAAINEVATAEVRSGAAVRELLHRSRRLGQAWSRREPA
jgi:glycosyltransferase involved in cell wall biosynthesis